MVLRNKLLTRRGLYLIHPWPAFFYLIIALALTMCSVNPLLILSSLISASLFEMYDIGIKSFAKYLPWLLLVIVITTIGNMIISHNGMHVLFYVNDNRITFEAGLYGVVFGLMFSAAFLWCDIMHRIITGEKLTYMFGSFAPNLGLIIAMTLHYIPLLRQRYKAVHDVQLSMGRGSVKGPIAKARQWGKEFGIVISWSLENSIETSSTMLAMGYGVGKRSNYSDYRIKALDIGFIMSMIVLCIPAFIVTLFQNYKVYYYPEFGMMSSIYDMIALSVFYLIYMLIPLILARFLRWH